MAEVIIVIHLLIVLALVGLVLMQKSEGGGLGMGSGGGFMTARGTANVLSRTTGILALAFFVTSLTLSILASGNRQPRSILDGSPTGPASQQQAPTSGPVIPSTGQGVLDQLRQQQQQQQPQAPQGPAIPAPGPAPAPAPAQ